MSLKLVGFIALTGISAVVAYMLLIRKKEDEAIEEQEEAEIKDAAKKYAPTGTSDMTNEQGEVIKSEDDITCNANEEIVLAEKSRAYTGENSLSDVKTESVDFDTKLETGYPKSSNNTESLMEWIDRQLAESKSGNSTPVPESHCEQDITIKEERIGDEEDEAYKEPNIIESSKEELILVKKADNSPSQEQEETVQLKAEASHNPLDISPSLGKITNPGDLLKSISDGTEVNMNASTEFPVGDEEFEDLSSTLGKRTKVSGTVSVSEEGEIVEGETGEIESVTEREKGTMEETLDEYREEKDNFVETMELTKAEIDTNDDHVVKCKIETAAECDNSLDSIEMIENVNIEKEKTVQLTTEASHNSLIRNTPEKNSNADEVMSSISLEAEGNLNAATKINPSTAIESCDIKHPVMDLESEDLPTTLDESTTEIEKNGTKVANNMNEMVEGEAIVIESELDSPNKTGAVEESVEKYNFVPTTELIKVEIAIDNGEQIDKCEIEPVDAAVVNTDETTNTHGSEVYDIESFEQKDTRLDVDSDSGTKTNPSIKTMELGESDDTTNVIDNVEPGIIPTIEEGAQVTQIDVYHQTDDSFKLATEKDTLGATDIANEKSADLAETANVAKSVSIGKLQDMEIMQDSKLNESKIVDDDSDVEIELLKGSSENKSFILEDSDSSGNFSDSGSNEETINTSEARNEDGDNEMIDSKDDMNDSIGLMLRPSWQIKNNKQAKGGSAAKLTTI